MASVHFMVVAPDAPNLVVLHILESQNADGPFNVIDDITNIGTYPNYITQFSTDQASTIDDYFAIQWEDSDGVLSPVSAAMQGGRSTLVAVVTDRVLLRDPSLNTKIVAQEAEVAICEFYNTDDPYSIDPASVSLRITSGLMWWTLARVYVARIATSTQANKFTAGLVSLDTSTATAQSWDNIDNLIKLANKELERNYSVLLMLKPIPVAGGGSLMLVSEDVSRSIVEIQ